MCINSLTAEQMTEGKLKTKKPLVKYKATWKDWSDNSSLKIVSGCSLSSRYVDQNNKIYFKSKVIIEHTGL